MRLLLVNNDSDTWSELCAVAGRAGYDITKIHHSIVGAIDPRGYDVAVLSGGWWYDDEVELLQAYAEEIQFIRTTPIPILGICIGMQLMHVSLDQAVPLLDTPQSGYKNITLTKAGQIILELPSQLHVFKNHTRGIIDTDPSFKVLATSPGHTEIMMHHSRPLLGVQFHPEVGTDQGTVTMFNRLITLLKPQF